MTQNVETPAIDALVENPLFVRLQRYLKIRNTSALALVGCLGLVELLPLGIGIGLWPAADIGKSLPFAIGFNLVVVLLYALISAVAPHSGADYVFSSRVLPAPLAFGAKFTTQLLLAAAVGALAVLVAQAVLTPFLYYTAWYFDNSALSNLAVSMAQPQGATIVGAIVIGLAFFLSTFSPKANSRFLIFCILIALLGWAVILYQLFSGNPADFAAQWDLIFGQGSYVDQVTLARGYSLFFGVAPNWLVLAGIPLGFLLFWGARIPSEVSGEVKNSASKNQLWGGWFAVLVCGGLALGSTVLVNRALPADWLAAESQLFLYNNQLRTPAMPWLPFYAAVLRPNYVLFLLSSLGTLAGLIAALQTFIRAFGRVWLAWTKDELLPELTGYIHAGSQSPLVTTLFVAVLAEVGVAFAANLGVMRVLSSVMFGLVCMQVFPALAAVLFPLVWRKKSPSGLMNLGKGTRPLLALSGLIVLVYLGVMILNIFIFPSQGNNNGGMDFILPLIFFALGVGWFVWRSRETRKQGGSLAEHFREFPEE